MALKDFIISLNISSEREVATPGVAVSITQAYKSVSNKYVDITFSDGVYINDVGIDPVTIENFSIVDLVASGVTAVSITAVKMNTHYSSGTALSLIGGVRTVRLFLSLTGTPDSTETFKVKCSDIYSPDGAKVTVTSPAIKLNVTPLMLWDYLEPGSVTTTGLGISTLSDVMGVADFVQATDANRPLDGTNSVILNASKPMHMSAGDVASAEFQKGDSFTVVVKRYKPTNSGTGGYLISKRGPNSSTRGWSVSTGADGSLFFLMHDGTSQGVCDYDAFSPAGAEHTLFFINNNGTLNIINDANTTLGTTGNATAIGTIAYTTTEIRLGRKDSETTNSYMSGSFEKIAIINKAMSLTERNAFLENL